MKDCNVKIEWEADEEDDDEKEEDRNQMSMSAFLKPSKLQKRKRHIL